MSSEDERVRDGSSGSSCTGERGNLVAVSAPSGAGKSTLVEMVLARLERLRYSISYTTRKARGTERHGVDYYFVPQPEFLAMRERDVQGFTDSLRVESFALLNRQHVWLHTAGENTPIVSACFHHQRESRKLRCAVVDL